MLCVWGKRSYRSLQSPNAYVRKRANVPKKRVGVPSSASEGATAQQCREQMSRENILKEGLLPDHEEGAAAIIKYSKQTSSILQCEVNGLSVDRLVDTGSRVSLIRKSVLKILSERPRQD